MQAWQKVTAAYRLVNDSRHLQPGCQEPGSALEPYARRSNKGYLYLFTVCKSAQDKDVKLPVYLMIRRGKTTYFVDVFENTKVVDLKKMLECLTRQLAGDMRLFRENEQVTDDSNYK